MQRGQSHSCCILFTLFLVIAIVLVAWGIYGMVTFTDLTGSGYDDRFFVFDNGVFPFLWGCLLLLAIAFLRFLCKLRRPGSKPRLPLV
ncbi:hypothetical protein BRN91_14515 [Xanthomonas oryzae pv. oryzae]|nr:hypothetical protein BRN91_14515 [Xanthomonas oryzae pv. oryzae]